MTRRVFRSSLAAISVAALLVPLAWAAPAQTAPSKGPLFVTYYFLPG